MKQHNIRQETINKTVNCINDLLRHIDQNGGKIRQYDSDSICGLHKTSKTTLSDAVQMGIFIKIGMSTYKSKIAYCDPKTARKLIELRYDRYNNAIVSKKKKNNIEHKRLEQDSIKPIKQKNEIKPKKEFSFLWGLLKFNY